MVIRGIRRSFTGADKAVKIKEQRKTDLVMLEIVRSFTEIKKLKLKNMNISLTQSEMNELIYALGIAQMHGKMMRKDIAEKVSDKLYRALAVENVRLEKQLEHDSVIHDMNFKRRYIETGDY